MLSGLQGTGIDDQVDATLDRLLVEFGKEILAIVPGKVSTEVDARFSFDKKASIDKALHIIEVGLILYGTFLVLTKISSTSPSVLTSPES